MENKPVIVGIGEVLWDLLPSGKKAGGAPLNFVYHASRLGAHGYIISAVGNDVLGDEIMDEINNIKINHIIERVDYPTGTVVVELNEGIPSYTIIENVAWDHIPMTNSIEILASKTDAVCFGTLAQRSDESRNTIRKFLSLVPENSYRILDINLRKPFYSFDIIKESINRCNILKFNDEEMDILKNYFNIQSLNAKEVCYWFIDNYNLKYVILTAGADYSLICSHEASSYIKTPRVDVVDTVGAGDAFTGAFISSIMVGNKMEIAHQFAADLAAYVCTKAGAWII